MQFPIVHFLGNEPDAEQLTRIVEKVNDERYYHKSRRLTGAGRPILQPAVACKAWIKRFAISLLIQVFIFLCEYK